MSMMGGRRGGRSNQQGGPKAKFSQLLPYLAEHRGQLVLAVVLSLIGAGTNLAQPLLVGNVITVVQNHQDILPLALALVAITVVSTLASGVMYFVLDRAGEGVVLSARQKLARVLLRLPINEYDQRRTGDLVSRVGSDTTLLRAALTHGLVDAAACNKIVAIIFILFLIYKYFAN